MGGATLHVVHRLLTVVASLVWSTGAGIRVDTVQQGTGAGIRVDTVEQGTGAGIRVDTVDQGTGAGIRVDTVDQGTGAGIRVDTVQQGTGTGFQTSGALRRWSSLSGNRKGEIQEGRTTGETP